MRLLGVIFLIGFVTSTMALSFLRVITDEWETFKLMHKKAYQSPAEERLRMNIFLENRQAIAEHNRLYALGQRSYKLGMNQFGDKLRHEFASTMNGYRGASQQNRQGSTFNGLHDGIKIPDSIDWRAKGAVTPVKNQGECGSCWAFSTTGSLEGQHFRKTGKLVSLSEQDLVDCDTIDHGCNGGSMDQAFRFIKEAGGIDTEASYPYNATDGVKCLYKSGVRGATVSGYVDIPTGDEQRLKEAVATVGPISVAMDADTNEFMMYRSGIFETNQCDNGSYALDHGVLVVGYGTDPSSNKDYWIVKNSWGTSWGMQGYFLLRRNEYNMCGIATMASYPLV